MTVGEKEST